MVINQAALWVAEGVISAFVNPATKIWDVAPEEVILKVVGCPNFDFSGSEIDYSKAATQEGKVSIVKASNSGLYKALRELIVRTKKE